MQGFAFQNEILLNYNASLTM